MSEDIEQPTVMIYFSPELVERLKDWSEPVQVRIYESLDGSHHMEVRTVGPVSFPVGQA